MSHKELTEQEGQARDQIMDALGRVKDAKIGETPLIVFYESMRKAFPADSGLTPSEVAKIIYSVKTDIGEDSNVGVMREVGTGYGEALGHFWVGLRETIKVDEVAYEAMFKVAEQMSFDWTI
jgi:hypothetical protein